MVHMGPVGAGGSRIPQCLGHLVRCLGSVKGWPLQGKKETEERGRPWEKEKKPFGVFFFFLGGRNVGNIKYV